MLQDLKEKFENLTLEEAYSFHKHSQIALVCEDGKLARLEDENIWKVTYGSWIILWQYLKMMQELKL